MNTETTFVWPIKHSLVEYVEGLEDGLIAISGPAVREGNEFRFSIDLDESDYDPETRTGTLQFRGAVTLTGYAGAMRVDVRDPQLYLKGDIGGLALYTTSIFSGDRFEGVALVEVSQYEPHLRGIPKLTPDGPSVFGPQYQPGQEMGELTVRW